MNTETTKLFEDAAAAVAAGSTIKVENRQRKNGSGMLQEIQIAGRTYFMHEGRLMVNSCGVCSEVSIADARKMLALWS